MEDNRIRRCVNIDWLEVYAWEDNNRYPCNADYFRRLGYFVTERPYGTRQYSEMFTIQDKYGEPMLEVRRNPFSADSSFTGLNERSCHLRFVNRYCYFDNCVRILADFMIMHEYELQRIYRIDVAYDFRAFDYGDDPERFIKRYIEKKFSKVNQCKVRVFGDDGWNAFAWESVSWGSPTSMVGTKLYNKTKEMKAAGFSKPWIVQAWFECGLIESFTDLPDVWRIEFSMKSATKNWIRIEDSDAKRTSTKMIPHNLQLFDGRDRLWQRFQDLAHHYFRFKYKEYKAEVNSDGSRDLKRKDLCRDKLLFRWDKDHEFYKVDNVSRESQPSTELERLRRALVRYMGRTYDVKIKTACSEILKALEDSIIARHTGNNKRDEIDAIRLQIATRTDWHLDEVFREADRILQLLEAGEIW